jgi:hypothetical protein
MSLPRASSPREGRSEDLERRGLWHLPKRGPEDLVIYKTIAWHPQHQQDVERLLSTYRDTIDLNRVRRIVGEFAGALDQPERLAEFERLLARLGR